MFLSRVMALPMACLILLLSLSSVSHRLHELVFHGDEGCSHSLGDHSCGTHDRHDGQEGKGEEELPCPLLLLAKSFLAGDYKADLTFSIAFVFESDFLVSPSTWVFRKHDPFGARDPPFFA